MADINLIPEDQKKAKTPWRYTTTILIVVIIVIGVILGGLFLYARNKSKKASELAAVDATQSSEVIFAMAGEILILNAPLPNGMALGGIFLVFAGLALFIRFQEGVE